MKTFASLFALLLGSLLLAQAPSDLTEDAPADIDQALRARITQFYGYFQAGKFKDAYTMVSADSQEQFFTLAKGQYKSFDVIKIRYTKDFAKAIVLTAVKTEMHFHGVSTPTTYPLTSNWKIVNGEWDWYYEAPDLIATPFSPTGSIPAPKDDAAASKQQVPSDINSMARQILTSVKLDKASVQLQANAPSRDVVHVRNEMPGEVTLTLGGINLPGLKVTLSKTTLSANEESIVTFEWTPQKTAPTGHPTARVQVDPVGKVLPIAINF